jgi:hypothetical protein
MADFCNRNFVSARTNFDGTSLALAPNASYPMPNGDAGYSIEPTTWSELGASSIPSSFQPSMFPDPDDEFDFIGTPVFDGDTQVAYNHRSATYSMFDDHLRRAEPPQALFSYNAFNIRASSEILFPTTTQYSAGFIDYFFRGFWNQDTPAIRLQVVKDAGGATQLAIANNSPTTLHAGGKLQVFYDRRTDGERQLLTTFVLPHDISPNASLSMPLPAATLYSNAKIDGQVIVIYDGSMGDDVVSIAGRVCNCPATAVDVSDPDSDCRALCPCQTLRFEEGDPGTVDDDTVVVPAPPFLSCVFGNCRWSRQFLTPSPTLTLSDYDDELGLAISIFTPDGRVDLHSMLGSYSSSTGSCAFCQRSSSASGPNEADFIPVQVSGASGVAVPFSGDEVASIENVSCSCGGQTSFPVDSFWKLSFCYGSDLNSCSSEPVPIAALLACHGAVP